MHFALSYPIIGIDLGEELLTAPSVGEICGAAEDAGFAAISFTEHPATPVTWRDDHGHDALDPFVGLGVAAAQSTTLRLLSYATVVPYRNPFLLAKAVATLDRMSGGRVVLGVGTGYLRGEFEALGVDFDQRNALFDESIAVLRRAWTGEPVTFRGQHFSATDVVCRPTPRQPRIPVWIGGNSAVTRRRVAQWADGWLPIQTRGRQVARRSTAALETTEELAGMITKIRTERELAGNQGRFDVMYSVDDLDPLRDTKGYLERVSQLERVGVTWLNYVPPGPDLDEAATQILRFGRAIIAAASDSAVARARA
jgi:probable F420-dependent oxidoreductase